MLACCCGCCCCCSGCSVEVRARAGELRAQVREAVGRDVASNTVLLQAVIRTHARALTHINPLCCIYTYIRHTLQPFAAGCHFARDRCLQPPLHTSSTTQAATSSATACLSSSILQLQLAAAAACCSSALRGCGQLWLNKCRNQTIVHMQKPSNL